MMTAEHCLGVRSTINAALGWHRHPRNGKIARLPESIRNLINSMLDDGRPYRLILQRVHELALLPYPISQMNLSNWFHGGYQECLQNKLDAVAGINALSPELKAQFLLCNPAPAAATQPPTRSQPDQKRAIKGNKFLPSPPGSDAA